MIQEEAKKRIFEYIEMFYNRERRHSSLGFKNPVDFEGRLPYLNQVSTFSKEDQYIILMVLLFVMRSNQCL